MPTDGLSCLEQPFWKIDRAYDVLDAKKRGEAPSTEDHPCKAFEVYPGLWDLLQSCWTDSSGPRLTIDQALVRISDMLPG